MAETITLPPIFYRDMSRCGDAVIASITDTEDSRFLLACIPSDVSPEERLRHRIDSLFLFGGHRIVDNLARRPLPVNSSELKGKSWVREFTLMVNETVRGFDDAGLTRAVQAARMAAPDSYFRLSLEAATERRGVVIPATEGSES